MLSTCSLIIMLARVMLVWDAAKCDGSNLELFADTFPSPHRYGLSIAYCLEFKRYSDIHVALFHPIFYVQTCFHGRICV